MAPFSHPNYILEDAIGEGGMSVVYLAEHRVLRRPVAIKFLKPEYLVQTNIRNRFMAEGRNMFSMNHPHIVRVTDLIDEPGVVAIVMEYVPGITLKGYLEKYGALEEEDIRYFLPQMLDALGYIHGLGFVHRDIKPANFMVTPDGNIKLFDFGIAKQLDADHQEHTATGTNQMLGTPLYMSPEQVKETRQVTHHSDIYSMGVVLWQMVTGKRPYSEATLSTYALQRKIVEDSLPDTGTIWDGVIAKACAKEPLDRFSDARTFKMAMQEPERYRKSSYSDKSAVEADATVQINRSTQPLMESPPIAPKPDDAVIGSRPNPDEPPWKFGGVVAAMVLIATLVAIALGIGFLNLKNVGKGQDTNEAATENTSLEIQSDTPEITPSVAEFAEEKTNTGLPESERAEKDNTPSEGVNTGVSRLPTTEGRANLNTRTAIDDPQLVFVRGGTFTMGCTSEQGSDCLEDEKPAHQVAVSDFYIGKYEVTQKQWREVMGTNPSSFKDCDECPVEQVSWADVQEFIIKLRAKTGKQYRLPTEAEWEYAARGGSMSWGYKYSGSNMMGEVGWYLGNAGGKTHPVGQKQANELGLYDMSGNVWEWCEDWYGEYSRSAQRNPRGPSGASDRVNRGGSWNDDARSCRTSIRDNYAPSLRGRNLGFRLAL